MSDTDAQAGDPQDGSKRAGMLPTILAVVILTVVAVGGGAGMGMMLASAPTAAEPAPAASAPAEAAEPAAPPSSDHGAESAADAADAADAEPGEASLLLVPLKPVLTNLYSPANTWLRLEAALVIRDDDSVDPEILAAQIEADTLVFLRSVQLAQLEGTRGLLHLREDLNERARLRSPAVVDYLIRAMVAE